MKLSYDILVNNAGYKITPMVDMRADFEQVIKVDLVSPLLFQAVVKGISNVTKIINICSMMMN